MNIVDDTVKKITKKYDIEKDEYDQESKKEEIEKAKKEHPEETAFQSVGYMLRDRKGEFSLDKTPVKDILQLFAGQKVRLVIYHADADIG